MTPVENNILDIVAVRQDRGKTAKGFPFKLLREIGLDPVRKKHLIKGIFVRGETSMWYGPPGSLKSSLMADAAIALAAGGDWFGRRNKERCAVIYWALERNDLVERRLVATASTMDLPVAVISDVIDIVNGRDNAKVIATVREVEDATGFPVGVVVFDTFSKLIGAGNGDEDKARDQNRLFANMQRIKNQTEVHIALIGHTGKDENRGTRGSNASQGDVDLEVLIAGDVIKTATVKKANDAPEGPLFSFKSIVHEFGLDEDGDPITVNIVSSEDVSFQSEPKPAEPKLSTNQRVMYRLLAEAGAAGLSVEAWNDLAKENGITAKQRHYEIRMALKDKGMVREYAGIWKVNP